MPAQLRPPHDIPDDGPKPWTDLGFRDDADDFRLAIFPGTSAGKALGFPDSWTGWEKWGKRKIDPLFAEPGTAYVHVAEGQVFAEPIPANP